MKKRTIAIELTTEGIERAINELNAYKQELVQKTETLRKRVAELLANEARQGFNSAIVDDLINDSKRIAQVDVSVDNNGDVTLVIADSKDAKKMDAVWVEFGTGVYHNGSPGSSPHPNGAELGFTIGGFGEGRGKRQVWGFKEDGVLKLTHGTPAKMPMARAVSSVINDIQSIVQEVFG